MKRLLALVMLLAGGCSSDLAQYQSNQPRLIANQFFKGPLCAWGTVRDYGDDVSRRFVADIKATATEDSFELDETFRFDDGEIQTRLWRFSRTPDGWVGKAADVVGDARGVIHGNMMSLKYTLAVSSDGDVIEVSMDDELHLIDNKNLLGKTIMTKFGLQVGEINLLMQKQTDNSQCNLTGEGSS